MPGVFDVSGKHNSVVTLRLSARSLKADGTCDSSRYLRIPESGQFGIPNAHCREFEKVALCGSTIKSDPKSNLCLTLEPENLFFLNRRSYWGFSALCAIDDQVVGEKFVDWDVESKAHVQKQLQRREGELLTFSFDSLDAGPGETLSVAFFLYSLDPKGVRLNTPTLYTVLSIRLCNYESGMERSPRLDVDFMKERRHPWMPSNPDPPRPTRGPSITMKRSAKDSSSPLKRVKYDSSIGYRIAGATASISPPEDSNRKVSSPSNSYTPHSRDSIASLPTRSSNTAASNLATELLRKASRDVAKHPIRTGDGRGKEKQEIIQRPTSASMENLQNQTEKPMSEGKDSKSTSDSTQSPRAIRKISESSKVIRNRYHSNESLPSGGASTQSSRAVSNGKNESHLIKSTSSSPPDTRLRAWAGENPAGPSHRTDPEGETVLRNGGGGNKSLHPSSHSESLSTKVEERNGLPSQRKDSLGEGEPEAVNHRISTDHDIKPSKFELDERKRARLDSEEEIRHRSSKSHLKDRPEKDRDRPRHRSSRSEEGRERHSGKHHFKEYVEKEVSESRSEIRKRPREESEREGGKGSRTGSSRDSRRGAERESRREKTRESKTDDRKEDERDQPRSRGKESQSGRESRNGSPGEASSRRRGSKSKRGSRVSTPSRTEPSIVEDTDDKGKLDSPDYDLSKEREEIRVLRLKVAEESRKVETLSREISIRKELEAALAELRELPNPDPEPEPRRRQSMNHQSDDISLASQSNGQVNGSHHIRYGSGTISSLKRKHEPEEAEEDRRHYRVQGDGSIPNSSSIFSSPYDQTQEDASSRNIKGRKIEVELERKSKAELAEFSRGDERDVSSPDRSPENENGADISDSESDRSIA